MKFEKLFLLLFFLLCMLFLVGCAQKEVEIPPSVLEEIVEDSDQAAQGSNAEIQEPVQQVEVETTPPSQGLGRLCSGEEECLSFCEIYRGECEGYCNNNKENEVCKIIFPPDEFEEPSQHQPQGTSESQEGCSGKGPVQFTSPPMRIEEIGFILPIGTMETTSGHITPIDHGYYIPPNWKPEDWNNPAKFIDVLAPADGLITDINLVGGRQGDYRLVIYYTCTFYTIYIHVRELSSRIAQVLENDRLSGGRSIQVKAGEVIGIANRFDFSVHNDELILKGFIIPEHYEVESWKIHTDDMFAYFVEPLKTQLLEKNVRQKEPRSGKIDHDIDGKLVGNWFLENTEGYRGGGVVSDYWTTHLVFAYDGLDPSLIVISIGDFGGQSKGFAVKGNTPNPANVNVNSGLVKYELAGWEYMTDDGRYWDRLSFAKITKAVGNNYVEGVVLVQMISDRKIKFEAFPDKPASQVSGFTENAKIYER